ncbi:MAG: hypothetical protein RJB13_1691 [Pseudomonadota bacterium]
MNPSLPNNVNPEQLLKQGFNPENEDDVATVLDQLRVEPDSFSSARTWYDTFSELSDAISETQTQLDLLLSLNVDDTNSKERIAHFETRVLSQIMAARAELMDIYLKSVWRGSMHADDKQKLADEVKTRRRYTHPKLANLQIEENSLVREFKDFSSHTQCDFQGRSTPLGVVVGKLNDARSEVRKNAFEGYWKKMHEASGYLEALFTRLLENRIAQAEAAGASSYNELCFLDLGRFDYNSQDCRTFRDSIRTAIVPMVSNLQSKQLLSLGTATLKPWDTNFWPKFSPSEKPCQGDLFELEKAAGRIFSNIHSGFGKFFSNMQQQGYIDIHPRRAKAPGAFCVVLPKSKSPFIFGNFAGNFRDAFTLLHEFGHALHGSATLQIRNPLARQPGLEFCEFASMGIEFLSQPFLSEFWPRRGDAQRAWALHCYNALQFWPFMALIDEWQHDVYENKLLDPNDRSRLWKSLSQKYRPNIDWSEHEAYEELGWLSRPHPMTSPFYYIDYGIAQLGAVQLWKTSKQNYQKAVEDYIFSLTLGAQRNLPELFKAAGLKFDFSAQFVESLGEILAEQVETSAF